MRLGSRGWRPVQVKGIQNFQQLKKLLIAECDSILRNMILADVDCKVCPTVFSFSSFRMVLGTGFVLHEIFYQTVDVLEFSSDLAICQNLTDYLHLITPHLVWLWFLRDKRGLIEDLSGANDDILLWLRAHVWSSGRAVFFELLPVYCSLVAKS